MRPPIPHYPKGDTSAATARHAELAKREKGPVGRPRKPDRLKKTYWSSIALTRSDYGQLKSRAEFEGRPMARIVRMAIVQYLRTHQDHL